MSSSTTQTGASTSSSTPSPTSTGNSGGGPSSSLYLFTFLATLFLLLFVSSAIILRSFILRRRFRRRIEEAILAGVITPEHTSRVNRRRAIGEKPKLWEARVSPASDDRWDAVVPVSVLAASPSGGHAKPVVDADVGADVGGGTTRPGATAAVPAPIPLPTHNPPRPLHRSLWLRNPFSRRRGTSSPLGSPPTSEPMLSEDSAGLQRQNIPPSSTHHDRLQVTVLIAMPDPRRPHLDGMAFAGHSKGKDRSLDLDYDEDDLPEMALGMTEVHFGDTITTPKSP